MKNLKEKKRKAARLWFVLKSKAIITSDIVNSETMNYELLMRNYH